MKWMHAAPMGAVAVALLAAGCLGDPGLDGREGVDVDLDASVERGEWESAEPGCEDVSPRGLRLVECEGEPLLGALVDARGHVRCVDGLSLLLREVSDASNVDPSASDPSPQPSHPGLAGMREPLHGPARPDPTPTPMVKASRPDPTPTPMGRDDPTPTPMDREDPTPTPM